MPRVEAPSIPGSRLKTTTEQFAVEHSRKRAAQKSRVCTAYQVLNEMNDEQLIDVAIWLAERPISGIDPVRAAIGAVNALTETEFVAFMQCLRESVDNEIWEYLTDA